ncbi:hypothetical protein Drorol1_Dr00013862, partial [Drosera rotundifolia]
LLKWKPWALGRSRDRGRGPNHMLMLSLYVGNISHHRFAKILLMPAMRNPMTRNSNGRYHLGTKQREDHNRHSVEMSESSFQWLFALHMNPESIQRTAVIASEISLSVRSEIA